MTWGVRSACRGACRGAWLAVALSTLFAACSGDGLAEGTCASARDCASGEGCVSGSCVAIKPREECSGDDACGAEQFCDQGTCRDRAAIQATPDGGISVASPDATVVPSTCATDPECGAGQICEGTTCVPGCASAGSPLTCAAATEMCNATTGRCEPVVAPMCQMDAECGAPRQVCESGACVAGCAEAGAPACGAGTQCDAATGRCAAPPPPPPCADDAACGSPAGICEQGACAPGCNSVGGASCGAGTVCNTNTGRCQQVAGPCTMDAQCMAPLSVCEGGQCVGGCGQPGGIQCSGSTACNAATGRCDPVAPPPCQADAACNPPSTVCETGACVPGCATSGCTGGNVCNASNGRCEAPPPPPPTCAVDQFEDNDSAAAARVGLAAGQTFANLTACAMDEDFYAFDLGVGDVLRAEALFAHADGDVDLQILTPAGTAGVSGSSTNDDEDVSYTAIAAGRHVVRVYLFRDQGTNPGNTYSLRLTHTPAPPPPPPPMCTPDRLEENDTQATARATAIPATENGLTSCTMDDDFYALSLAAGDEVTATATFLTSEGDVDVALLDAAGTTRVSSTGVTGTERVVFAAAAPGTYALRVYLYGDAGTTPGAAYSLGLTRRVICTPDPLEENDTQAAQRPITAGTVTDLSACDLDDDYYRVTLAAGQPITVNLAFAHAEGDIDLFLLNAAGTTQVSSVSVDDDESVTFTPTSAGNYTIRVRLYGDLGTRPGNFYNMTATF